MAFVGRLLDLLADRIRSWAPVETTDEWRRRYRDWEYHEANERDAGLYDDEEWGDLNAALRISREDPAAGFAAYLILAGTGSAAAMNVVGEAYSWGKGVAADKTEGERWYRLAYIAGSKRALLNYGRALAHRGDLAGAEIVFSESASQGWSPAMYWLAEVLLDQGDAGARREEARALLERAAMLGNPDARWKLIRLLIKGPFGFWNTPRALAMGWALARENTATLVRERCSPERKTA